MTNTEKNAEYIKTQRKKVVDMIADICKEVALHVINYTNQNPYEIYFECSSCVTEIRVYDKESTLIEKVDFWALDQLFIDDYFHFSKERFEKKLKPAFAALRSMKNVVKKYNELNKKKG